jgi:hypothetical protein
MTDNKKYDKNANPLNLMPNNNKESHGYIYDKWQKDPSIYEPDNNDIKCELQLQSLSAFEPLHFAADYEQFKKEIKTWNDYWVPYLRREGISNDREGLLLMGLEGDSPTDSLSMPEAVRRTGRTLTETDFCYPTELYYHLQSLRPLLDIFQPLGRTMLVKTNAGGFFPPHKDSPMITRNTFRIVVFIGKQVDHEAYEWEMEGQIQKIKPNRAYYVDTRKTHRTHSWVDNSIHCIINVPKTWENVIKLMSLSRYA